MLNSRFRLGAVLVAVLSAAVPAGAQQEYPPTLYWGTGLIDIPVAWIPSLSGDFFLNYTGKTFEEDPTNTKINYSNTLNSQFTFAVSGWGRVELGYAAYSGNPEFGFFGRALLLNEDNSRPGFRRWLPGIAVGIRNVGPYEHIDRFGIGYQMLPPTADDPNFNHVPDALHEDLDTRNSVYGVMTKGFSLAEIQPNWADIDLSFTVGYGGGLFQEEGGIRDYGTHDRGGFFYGIKTDFAPTPNVMISVMGEDNGWDYNLGASVNYRGIRAGAYLTEVGAGSANVDPGDDASLVYGYQKFAFTVGWQSNIFALMRGEFLQSRAARLEQDRQALLAAIAERQQRIAQLELEINRYEAQNLLELEQRRVQAEEELKREREALQRLEERLRQIERQIPPGGPTRPPPPPPSPTSVTAGASSTVPPPR